jgi:hypothetical protein
MIDLCMAYVTNNITYISENELDVRLSRWPVIRLTLNLLHYFPC